MLSLAIISNFADPRDSTRSIAQTSGSINDVSLNSASLGETANGSIVIYYFWAIGCSHCAATEPFIDEMAAKYPETNFLRLEITHNVTNYYLFKDFNAAFNIGGETTPSLFIENEVALIGSDAIRADLESTILRLIEENSILPPTAPQNLIANAGNGNVVLTWSIPANDGGATVTGYKVYRGTVPGGQGGTPIATLGNVLTYTNIGLNNGQTYYYVVSAVNSDGEGARSNEASATPVTVPTAPQNLIANAGNGNVVLTWSVPANNGGTTVTGYKVYRGTTPGGQGATPIATLGGVLTYTNTGLTNGVTYFYKVSAVNSVGEGARSNEASATPVTVPTAPSLISATPGNAQVILVWTAPSSNGGSTITNYTVYRGVTSGGEAIITTVGNVLMFTDTGLTDGQIYYYRVSAVNGAGEGARSNQLNAIPVGPPTAIQNLQAHPGDAHINLTWQAPVSNGGSAITNYEVWRGTFSGSETFLADAHLDLWFNSTGLTNGQTYYYIIKAENAQGSGPSSNEVSAKPSQVQTAPAAPQSLTSTAGNGQIVLTWSVPANNGGATVTNYRVYRGATPGGETLLLTLGSVLTYTDRGLTNCQTYYYRVSAVNSIGEGAKSNELGATPATVPTAPKNLQGTYGNAYINLTWQAPSSNGCSVITGYQVWRGNSSGSETFLADAHLDLWFNSTGLTNGQTYYYRVSAVNSIGEGLKSNELNATPATVPTAPQNLQGSPGDAYINLTWQAPVSNGGSAITNFEVWRGTSSGTETFLADAHLDLWLNDTGLAAGQNYYYRVRAVNAQGIGSSSNEANAATHIEMVIAPSVPQNLTITAGNGMVSLSWNEPTSSGSAALLGYRIFRGTNPDSMTLIDSVLSTNYTDTDLTNGQAYHYKVCAYSSAGDGMMTDTVVSIPRDRSSTDLTIGMVIAAAAVDSINPCAISVMIFLLMFLTSLGNKRRVLLVGIAYIVTVFLVYFIAGVGLLTFLQSTSMTRYVYYGAALLSIAIGVINIKDYFFPGNKPTVAIPESRKPLIKKYIEKASIPAAVALGAMVSAFELPCTGGIYLAILSLLGDSMTAAQGIPYLVLYNLIFVVPLIVILGIIYMGVSPEKANEWRLEKRSKLRLVVGLVMLLLGAMMLLGVV